MGFASPLLSNSAAIRNSFHELSRKETWGLVRCCCPSSLQSPPSLPLTLQMKETWRLVWVLFLGQLLSLFLSICSFTNSYAADLNIDVPLTRSLFVYLSMAVVYGAIFLYRRQKLLVHLYWYATLAIIDVQGVYLFVQAYHYSSITSVTLLDCLIIAWVMILIWFILKTRYSQWQFLGVVICVVGLVLVLFPDARESGGGGKNPLLGDTIVIAGTICLAMSNVAQEFLVKKKDRVEAHAMIGLFGLLVSMCEMYPFKQLIIPTFINLVWHSLSKWTRNIALFAGYTAASFLFETLAPFLLKMSGATLLNLSLLTSDMWAVLIRIFFYKQQVNWLYYLAFSVVAVGLIIYSLNETTHESAEMIEGEETKPLSEDTCREAIQA